jgi:hypothetical protein
VAQTGKSGWVAESTNKEGQELATGRTRAEAISRAASTGSSQPSGVSEAGRRHHAAVERHDVRARRFLHSNL